VRGLRAGHTGVPHRVASAHTKSVCSIVVTVTDLEAQITLVRSADARRSIDEAMRCYNAGAIRASITMTWTAVIVDIIDKIVELAEGGDADAQSFRTKIDDARAVGLKPAGVQAMQRIEDSLLADAERFELIDSVNLQELGRIREDRNLCVHPPLRPQGETYDPRPEVARAHLAVALSTVLIHPPTQGRRAIEDFTAYVSDPSFTTSDGHLQTTFFDRTRTATRRNLVKVAAKHALWEVEPPTGMPVTATILADRMADALSAFAHRDRELVRATLRGLYPRFQPQSNGVHVRAVTRLGDQDFFWDMIEPPLAEQLDATLAKTPIPGESAPLPTETASLLALVRDANARARLPSLEKVYASVSLFHRATIAGAHPDTYFLPVAVESMRAVGSWRSAERFCELVILPHGRLMPLGTLREVLESWWSNYDCRTAARMPEMAVRLFWATAHIGTARHALWQQFIREVSTRADAKDLPYYSYSEVEQAIIQDGGSPATP
jgi:hypothetical protein